MLTRLTLRNFKRFHDVEIELGSTVAFVGPNNSGKTSALQALALWEVGLRRWNEKRAGKATPEKRPGVTINRRDLLALPVPQAKLLWRDLHTHAREARGGRTQTKNIRIEILVEGVTKGQAWRCGFEFDYANEESFYCRPLRSAEGRDTGRLAVPDEAGAVRVTFLPPMSGLAATEDRLDAGSIARRLGEGKTAEVLRNLCHQVHTGGADAWPRLVERLRKLFGVTLDPPEHVIDRGEIVMTYLDARGIRLDLSSAGRGLQQTLLLLAYLQTSRGATLLLDEPDAHLEILRQRQIYQLLTDVARQQESQVILATHSEVLLNEAADRDVVVAFVGAPHRIDDRGSQLLKSLKEIGFDQYYQAEITGFVLYVEGSTDLAILRALAEALAHPARAVLERPFVHYVENQPQKARDHFHGLREARPDLVAVALFDRLPGRDKLRSSEGLKEVAWRRREIESYIALPDVLLAFAAGNLQSLGPLFAPESARQRDVMQRCIADLVPPKALRDPSDRWWVDTKATDDFLDPLFADFFQALSLPNLMRKTDYHVLAHHVAVDRLDPEIIEKLDLIWEVARGARRGDLEVDSPP